MKGSFKALLSAFLLDYLPRRRGCSANTVAGYRDAFVLLARYAESVGVRANDLRFEVIGREFVEGYLEWLSDERGCSAQTCNNRLAAIKSFMRFVQVEAPERMESASCILSIKAKKVPQPDVPYLSLEGVAAILDSARDDLRDLALISLMYDSGARVQEICDASFFDVRLEPPATIKLNGKGGKTRVVPLTSQVADILSAYAEAVDHEGETPLFVNPSGKRIGRAGAAYVLSKHAAAARLECDRVPSRVTPHMMRHSKAMHMLEAGVNLVYIRDFLGHSSVTTTEIYARANPEMKRAAVDTLRERVGSKQLYSEKEKEDLIGWLKELI